MSTTEFVSTHPKSDTATPAGVPSNDTVPDRAEAPRQWTLKGLAPGTVEVSREAAKRSGMKLNAWVSRALEQAAGPDHPTTEREVEPDAPVGSDAVQLIQAELVRLRAESAEMRKTVETMTQILLKLCADKI